MELDVTGLVYAVNVAEAGGDGKVWGDWRESLVDGKDILWLSVKRVVIHILIVDTILFTTGDTNLHLEPLLHRGGTLEVLGGSLNVEVNLLLRQINHVAGEERLAVGLEVSLISVQKAIQPWEELLCAVIGV